MKTYLINVTTKEPLLIGDRHGDGSGALRSQDWIPGQTVRGAMAAVWEHSVAEAWFERAIANGEVSFSPLFPVACKPSPGDVWGQVPATALSCKRFGGFESEHEKHGVVDRALSRECWFGPGRTPRNPSECTEKLTGKACGSALEKFAGFFHMHRQGKTETVDLGSRLIARTALNDQIDSVADGRLYSLKPLNEEKQFAGLIRMPDDLNPTELLSVDSLRLGKARSRGLGRVSVAVESFASPFGGTLQKRIEGFQKLLYDRGLSVPDDETWATVDLWTPLLLRDPWMRDRLHPEPEDFEPFDPQLTWQVVPIALDAVWVGGWHGLLNLPRTHRQALAPGGVFALKIKGPRKKALAAMDAVETHGLGEAWADGFGRVLFCHPFHEKFIARRPLMPKPDSQTTDHRPNGNGATSRNHEPPAEHEQTSEELPVFKDLNRELVLRQEAQIAIDDEDRIRAWRGLAEKAHHKRLNRTQVRGLENVVNTAQSLSTILNYIYNQIPRVKQWNGWGEKLAAAYDEIPGLADKLIGANQELSPFKAAQRRQVLILSLARGMTAHFVAYNLFLGSVP